MQQFIMRVYDANEPGIHDRRLKVRDSHLKCVLDLRAKGNFIFGGALLDDEGKMIGSEAVVEFPTLDDVYDEWLKKDPFVTEGVWKLDEIELKPYRMAIRFDLDYNLF